MSSITSSGHQPFSLQRATSQPAAATSSIETKQVSVRTKAIGILKQQTTAYNQDPYQTFTEPQDLCYKFKSDVQLLAINIPLLQAWALHINREIAHLNILFPSQYVANLQLKWQMAFMDCVSELVGEKSKERIDSALRAFIEKINKLKKDLGVYRLAPNPNLHKHIDALGNMIDSGCSFLHRPTKISVNFLMYDPKIRNSHSKEERNSEIGKTSASCEFFYERHIEILGLEAFILEFKKVYIDYAEFISCCFDQRKGPRSPFAAVAALIKNFDHADPVSSGMHIKREICALLQTVNEERDLQKLQEFAIHGIFIKQMVVLIDNFLLMFHKDMFIPINNIQERLIENVKHLKKQIRTPTEENLITKPKGPVNIETQEKQIKKLLKTFFKEAKDLINQADPLEHTILSVQKAEKVLAAINSRYLQLLGKLLVQKEVLVQGIADMFRALPLEERQNSQLEWQNYVELLCLSLISHPLIFNFNELLLDSQACAQLNYNKENIERICEPLWKLIILENPEAVFDCSAASEISTSSSSVAPSQIEEPKVSTSSSSESEIFEAVPPTAPTAVASLPDLESKTPIWAPIYIPSSGSTVLARENDEDKCVAKTKAPKKTRPKKEVSVKAEIAKMRKRELLGILEMHGIKLSEERSGKGSHRALVREELDAKGNVIKKYVGPFPMGSEAETFAPGTVRSIFTKAGVINRS